MRDHNGVRLTLIWFICHVWFWSFKMEDITNETVNEQQAQNFENLTNDPLENSGNTLLDNSSDPDLHFFDTNIETKIHFTYILNYKFSGR